MPAQKMASWVMMPESLLEGHHGTAANLFLSDFLKYDSLSPVAAATAYAKRVPEAEIHKLTLWRRTFLCEFATRSDAGCRQECGGN
jgi:hypothetical protein